MIPHSLAFLQLNPQSHLLQKPENPFRRVGRDSWKKGWALAQLQYFPKAENPIRFGWGFQKKGDDILSHITAVPSAQAGLTSLFGMGRGEPRRNNHLKVFSLKSQVLKFKSFCFMALIFRLKDCPRRANILTYWDKETNSFFRKFPPEPCGSGKGCA